MADRLATLPLVLCGPVLRRVDRESVTVWLALKERRKVTLRVFASELNGVGVDQKQVGTRTAARVGERLYLVAVTATGQLLDWGSLYRYDLYFGPPDNDAVEVPTSGSRLFADGMVAPTAAAARDRLLYPAVGAPRLPTFVLPPQDLNKLRLIHGSCRKPHGESRDALVALDKMIEAQLQDPERRPHQLFLTGDQIYADDVADVLLEMLTDAGDSLLGWPAPEELLPGKTASALRPGRRSGVASAEAGFTADVGFGEPRSHLFSFGEFCAMYLFVWSEVMWPPTMPTWADVFPDEAREYEQDTTRVDRRGDVMPKAPWQRKHAKAKTEFEAQAGVIEQFRSDVPAVRRALANIPTSMIFDDHEVTDDWNITLHWCSTVYRKGGAENPFGRRVVQNALLAYALFQAWGNTPVLFAATGTTGERGRDLLDAVRTWDGTAASGSYDRIGTRVGIPTGVTSAGLTRAAGALDWSYVVTGPSHQVIVLDTRTERRYPGAAKDPPALVLTDQSFDRQLSTVPFAGPEALTIVISPAPVIGPPLVEEGVQRRAADLAEYTLLFADAEAWGLQPPAFEKLLARLFTRPPADADGVRRARVLVLSGDVHYGCAGRLRYTAGAPYHGSAAGNVEGVLVQLTSSALKNEEAKTHALHAIGYDPDPLAMNRAREAVGLEPVGDMPRLDRAGWANPGGARRQVGTSSSPPTAFGSVQVPLVVTGAPAIARLENVSKPTFTVPPEWRYQIHFILGENEADRWRDGTPRQVDFPPPGDRDLALRRYLESATDHMDYRGKWGNGKEIVGRNNIGELSFIWEAGDRKSAIQELWWRLPGHEYPFPLTKFEAWLSLDSGALYGGYDLTRGDHDKTATAEAIYAGKTVPEAAPGSGHVRRLQQDLLTLGFALVGTPDGIFNQRTEWAVREFQAYSRMSYTAREAVGSPSSYVERLSSVPVPGHQRYSGPISGALNQDTRKALLVWLREKWRCPVVVQAWNMSQGQPSSLRNDNIWLFDEVPSTAPRMYARDFSRYYALPPGRGLTDRHVVGEWVGDPDHTDPSGVGGFRFSGPRSIPPIHTWPDAELTTEALLGPAAALATLSQPRRSTFKAVRAVAEVECYGFADCLNCWDRALVSLGPCHWTLGLVTASTRRAEEGELCGFLSYLRHADGAAFTRAVEAFGLRADESWTDANGVPNGQNLLKPDRKYAGWLAQQRADGTWVRVAQDEDLGNYFRSWHWVYRWMMAGRTIPGFRQRMWDMARLRIRDIRSTPWGGAGVANGIPDMPDGAGGTRPVTIGDVFTSERAIGLLLRWHVYLPGHVVDPINGGTGGHRARPRLRNAYAAAGIPAGQAPSQWTDQHEASLVRELINAANAAGYANLTSTMSMVNLWPYWAGRASRQYTLPSHPPPANLDQAVVDTAGDARVSRLRITRNSFLFDGAGLPPPPDYTRPQP